VLAGELRGPVDAEGTGSVVLPIGPRSRSVEHVVGRVVDEERARVAGRAGEEVGRSRVDGEGGERLPFRRVHAVVGRGVEDDVRSLARDEGRDRRRVGGVDFAEVPRPHDLPPEEGDELAPELARRADDDGPHAPIDSARAKSRAVSPPASWVLRTRVTFE
jgi:hypothetical protein